MADVGRSPHHVPWIELDGVILITYPPRTRHRNKKLATLMSVPEGSSRRGEK
jgi:hypothetical protein